MIYSPINHKKSTNSSGKMKRATEKAKSAVAWLADKKNCVLCKAAKKVLGKNSEP